MIAVTKGVNGKVFVIAMFAFGKSFRFDVVRFVSIALH